MNEKLDRSLIKMFNISMAWTTHFLVKWAADAIAYYINSGRASTDWIKSFVKADVRQLLTYAAKCRDHSDKAMVQRATSYLKQHHHLTI
jgi:hypothetical protein